MQSCRRVLPGQAKLETAEHKRHRSITYKSTPYLKTEGNTNKCEIASTCRTLRGRRPLHAWKLHAREPGGPTTACHEEACRRLEKAMNHKPNMNVAEESGGRVVAAKRPNKGGKPSAEGAEGRRSTKENAEQTAAYQTQSWGNALSGLHRVREAA
jgi:hypothetical protein